MVVAWTACWRLLQRATPRLAPSSMPPLQSKGVKPTAPCDHAIRFAPRGCGSEDVENAEDCGANVRLETVEGCGYDAVANGALTNRAAWVDCAVANRAVWVDCDSDGETCTSEGQPSPTIVCR